MISPLLMRDRYGFEPFRYFLLREMSFGLDANFTEEALVERVNADLANNLGNLLSRTLNLVEKFCAATVPEPAFRGAAERDAARRLHRAPSQSVEAAMSGLRFHDALAAIVAFSRQGEPIRRWTRAVEGGEGARRTRNRAHARSTTRASRCDRSRCCSRRSCPPHRARSSRASVSRRRLRTRASSKCAARGSPPAPPSPKAPRSSRASHRRLRSLLRDRAPRLQREPADETRARWTPQAARAQAGARSMRGAARSEPESAAASEAQGKPRRGRHVTTSTWVDSHSHVTADEFAHDQSRRARARAAPPASSTLIAIGAGYGVGGECARRRARGARPARVRRPSACTRTMPQQLDDAGTRAAARAGSPRRAWSPSASAGSTTTT